MTSCSHVLRSVEVALWSPKGLSRMFVAASVLLFLVVVLLSPGFVASLLGDAEFGDNRVATVLGGSKQDASFSAEVVMSTVRDIRVLTGIAAALCAGASVALLARSRALSDACVRWSRRLPSRGTAARTDHMFVALVSVTTLIVALAATRNGAGLDPDSTTYIRSALNLVRGEEFGDVRWAPGYPLAIAGMIRLGVGATQAARLIPVISLALSVIPLYSLGRLLGGRLAGYFCCFIPLVLWPLALVSVYAWSEMPYVLFTLCATWALTVFMSGAGKRGHLKLLLIAAIAASVALLVRYIGVSIVAAGAIALLLDARYGLRRRLAHSVSYGIIAATPMVLWVAHNLLTTGTVAGERSPSLHGPAHYAFTVTRQIVRDLSSADAVAVVWSGGQYLVALALVSLATTIIFVIVRADDGRALARQYAARGVPVLAYVLGYLLTLIAIASLWEFLPIYVRFTMPVYPYIVLLLVSFGVMGATRLRQRAGRHAVLIFLSTALVILVSVQVPCTLLVHNGAARGYSYNSPFWRGAESVEWARGAFGSDDIVYTNDVYAVRLSLTGADLRWLPQEITREFLHDIAQDGAAVVAFKEYAARPNHRDTHQEIVQVNSLGGPLVLVKEFPEATVWSGQAN